MEEEISGGIIWTGNSKGGCCEQKREKRDWTVLGLEKRKMKEKLDIWVGVLS